MNRLFFFLPFFLIFYTHPALSNQNISQLSDNSSQVQTTSESPSFGNLPQTPTDQQPSASPQPADASALEHAKDNSEKSETAPNLVADDDPSQDAEYVQLIEQARQGSYAQALDGLSKLVKLHPENQKIQADYVTVLLWADKIPEAAKATNGLTMHSAPEYAVNSASVALWKNGDLHSAKQWATSGIRRFPENEDFPIQLAMMLADEKQFEQSEELLQGKTSTAANQAIEYVKRLKRASEKETYAGIIQQAREGDLTDALAQLEKLYQQTPAHSTIAADYLTVLTWDNKMHEAAVIASSIDVSQIPDYALAAGAEAFRKTGKLKEALQWYKEGAKRFPDNHSIRLGLALSLAESGQAEKGLALVESLPSSPDGARQLNESKRYIRRMIKAPSPIRVSPRAEKSYRPAQDAAVALARTGKIAQSLQTLKALHFADPADQYLLADYMVVLQWSRNNKQLITLLPKVQPRAFPSYGVAAVATAKTELGDHDGAIQFVEQMLTAQRRNPDLLIVGAEIYQGAGLFRQSVKLLDEVIAQKVPGMGHAIEATKRKTGYAVVKSMDDLERSNALLQRSATNQDGMILHAKGLGGIGGPHEAQKFLQGQVDFSPHNRQAIAIAAERKKTFWAERLGFTNDLKERNRLLHDALATLDSHKQVEGFHPALTDMNRIYPLYMLNENQAAVDIYEKLQKQNIPMSTTALLATAGAYLNLQQPLKAQHVFVILLGQENPQDILSADDRYMAMQGLFWAYLEAEQLTKAKQQAHANLAFCDTPPDGVGPIPKDDWKRSDAINTIGLATLYTGNYSAAEQHFTAILSKAPANTQARAGLAEVFSMRNLPRAAYEQTHIARMHEPDNLSYAVDEARRLMAANRWKEAEELVSALTEYTPYSNSVERLMRKWDTHNMHELHMWSSWSETRNSNPNSVANRNVPAFEWRLYSKPLLHNWRVFLGSLWDGGDFEEGTANRTMVLGGLEYRSPNLEANIQLYQDHVRNRRVGASLEGVFQPDDHWKFPFSAAKNTRHIPLRARYSKIYADSASIGIGYYWNESREINMAVGYMDFSDDNQRLTVQADFRQRLTNWDTQYLDMTIETHASHNSKDAERPYFNPKQDYEALAGLVYGDLLWRDYDKSLNHAVKVNGGIYNQKHHNSGAVWNVNYSQTLDWKDRFSTNYGASYGRAYYDGDSENELNLFINMTWKF